MDEAKTVLRRSGYTVYDAHIDGGSSMRGLVRVDYRTLQRDEVVAMAAAITEHEATRRAELRAQHGLKEEP